MTKFFDPEKMTLEEKTAWQRYQKANQEKGIRDAHLLTRQLFRKYECIRHLCTRYPKNHIDIFSLPKNFAQIEADYKKILDEAQDEAPLQKYFTEHPYLVCSVLCETSFGHHSAFIFPSFKLAEKYVPDFLLCGTSSAGYGWVFIELQSPACKILLANGQPAEHAREGLHQIREWKEWLRSNKDYAISKSGLDMEALHEARTLYCLIIGRRDEFGERENRWRDSEQANQKDLRIMTYDRLSEWYKTVLSKDPPNF